MDMTLNSGIAAIDNGSAVMHHMDGPYKVGDLSAGTTDLRVQSQWFNRPDDQRFLDLDSLYASVRRRSDASWVEVVESKDLKVAASRDDCDKLELWLPSGRLAKPTHWSFGQVASLVGAPAGYLRRLPAFMAGLNLQYGLQEFRGEAVKVYASEDDGVELFAATGPTYGRIFDHEVVGAVRSIAGNGVGDSQWKVPGVMDWRTGLYDPHADITKESTTLFASDRDVFLFLVDDTHPIEIGKLPDGSPDLVFRGFYAWNSEVGSKTFGLATFYLRAVCQNRILWGVEGHQEIRLRHSLNAPARFAAEAAPALLEYANRSTGKLLAGIQSARAAVVARTDDERTEFLARRGFNRSEVAQVLAAVESEEGRPAESVWDFVQGITAAARSRGHQDARIEFEGRAKKILDKVA